MRVTGKRTEWPKYTHSGIRWPSVHMLVLMVTSWVMSSALRSPASSCVLGNNSLPHLAHGTVVAPSTRSLKGGQSIMTILILVWGLLNL